MDTSRRRAPTSIPDLACPSRLRSFAMEIVMRRLVLTIALLAPLGLAGPVLAQQDAADFIAPSDPTLAPAPRLLAPVVAAPMPRPARLARSHGREFSARRHALQPAGLIMLKDDEVPDNAFSATD